MAGKNFTRAYKDMQREIELLLFDESLGPVSACRKKDYEELFQPVNHLLDTSKADRVYLKIYHGNDDLHHFY